MIEQNVTMAFTFSKMASRCCDSSDGRVCCITLANKLLLLLYVCAQENVIQATCFQSVNQSPEGEPPQWVFGCSHDAHS